MVRGGGHAVDSRALSVKWAREEGGEGGGGRESGRICDEEHSRAALDHRVVRAWVLARRDGWSRGLGVARLGRAAVGVLFVMTRRVITIPLRGTEAYLPRQVRLGRWAWGLEGAHFGGQAKVCEDASYDEGICDRGEQCAMAVAVWAAQDVFSENAFD